MEFAAVLKRESSYTLVLRMGVIHKKRLQCIGSFFRNVPHGLHLVEFFLLVQEEKVIKHRPILEMVAIEHRLPIYQARSRIVAVHKDLTAYRPLAFCIVSEVALIVACLVYGVIDRGTWRLNPTHYIGINRLKSRPIYLGRKGFFFFNRSGLLLIGNLCKCGQSRICLILLEVTPFGIAKISSSRQHKQNTYDYEGICKKIG